MTIIFRLCLLSLVLISGCGGTDPEKASKLVDLTLSHGLLTPSFASNIGGYTATVGEDVDSITVTVSAADTETRVMINGGEVSSVQGSRTISLNLGANTITINTFYYDYPITPGEQQYVLVVTRQAGSWSVGGTVTGLSGVLELQNNGADDLVLTDDGAFAFALPLPNGDSYDVIITSQPTGQTCDVVNAQGAVTGAAISNVSVTCIDTP